MADQSGKPTLGGMPQAAPEPWQAAHLVVAASVGEVLIGLGRSRMIFQATGQPQQAAEWFATVALSPIVAKQLRDALNGAIEIWERDNGTLPSVAPNVVETPAPQK